VRLRLGPRSEGRSTRRSFVSLPHAPWGADDRISARSRIKAGRGHDGVRQGACGGETFGADGGARKTLSAVITSKAKRSRLGDCGNDSVWIASLSLAMTNGPASM
jgi:hypothetical protein